MQIVQESLTDVRMRIIVTPQFTGRDEEQLLHNVREKLPQSMQVTIERVDALERTALGKTPFVIHRPAVKEALRRPARPAAGLQS